jgi:hypothetical protein
LDSPQVVQLPDGHTSEPGWFYPTLIALSLVDGLLLFAAVAGRRDGWNWPSKAHSRPV